MRWGLLLGGMLGVAASGAAADGGVDINRSVYVERLDDGVRALEPATTLKKGDKVVLVLAWRAAAPGRGLTIESAVPRPLAFQRAGSDAVEVSIDQGRTWGHLGELKVGARYATSEDVTRVRLRVRDSAPTGRLTYSAIVR